jgi:hypothetical protein
MNVKRAIVEESCADPEHLIIDAYDKPLRYNVRLKRMRHFLAGVVHTKAGVRWSKTGWPG